MGCLVSIFSVRINSKSFPLGCTFRTKRYLPKFSATSDIRYCLNQYTAVLTGDRYGRKADCSFLNMKQFWLYSRYFALASCFLYSLASKSIKCRGYPISIVVTQSLSWEIESNAFVEKRCDRRPDGQINTGPQHNRAMHMRYGNRRQ